MCGEVFVQLLARQVRRPEASAIGHGSCPVERVQVGAFVPRAEVTVEHGEQVGIAASCDFGTDRGILRIALAQVDFAHQAARLDQLAHHLPFFGAEVAGVGRHLHRGEGVAAGGHVIAIGPGISWRFGRGGAGSGDEGERRKCREVTHDDPIREQMKLVPGA